MPWRLCLLGVASAASARPRCAHARNVLRHGLLTIGFAVLAAAIPAVAAAGPGFGNGGWVRVGADYDGVAAIAVRANGRILVLTSGGFLQQRLSDGRRDRHFATGDLDDSCGCGSAHLALQPDGKALVAMQATIARFTTRGRRDPAFRISLGQDVATDIETLPDGRLVVAVEDRNGTVGSLRRFLADGRPDLSFGDAGTVALPADVVPNAIAVQADDAVVVAAGTAGVLRYLADGSRDPTLYPTTSGLDRVDVSAVAVQLDGKILAAGSRIAEGVVQTDVVRLLRDGAADPTFATNGVATWSAEHLIGVPTAVAALPDGAVAVAGEIRQTCFCKGAGWLAMRLTTEGEQEGFPVPGRPEPENDCWGGAAGALAVQPDGKLLIGGDMCDKHGYGGSSAFVGRLTPELALDAGPPLTVWLTALRRRHGHIAATLELSDAANVTAAIQRIGGSDAPLLRSSRLGDSTTIQARTLHASLGHARRIRLVLVFRPRSGAHYVLRIRADDNRDRTAEIRRPIHWPARKVACQK